jgi:pimeloyl-ACP methyl ester carboxylesterase
MPMTNPTIATLKRPGATIHYETRGGGPVLLIIPGGPQDAGVFAGLAEELADRYTVVAFDPRGNSRSMFDGDQQPLDVDGQADDAAALIRAVGGGPAYVFGTSGGAQIGFSLAARHPELVTALVAHEPPAMMLLDDPSVAVAEVEQLHQLYLDAGVDAAMAAFMGGNDLEFEAEGEIERPPPEMSAEAAATFARVSGNFAYWLAHGLLPLSLYRPDVATLQAGAARIVLALGEESRGMPIFAMGSAAAARLGIEATPVPGDHFGFETHTEEFASALHAALD